MSIKKLHETIQKFVDDYKVTEMDILFNKGNQITIVSQADKKYELEV